MQVCNEKLLGEIIMEVSRASLKRSRRAVRSEAWRVKRKVCTIVQYGVQIEVHLGQNHLRVLLLDEYVK